MNTGDKKGKPNNPSGNPPRLPTCVEVNFPPELVEKYEADKTQDHGLQVRIFWLSFLTFIFVVMTVIVTMKQWQAMVESNNINRDAVISVQRAFVTPGTAQAIKAVQENGQMAWQFWIPWENSGSTPTVNARGHVNYKYGLDDLPSDFAFPDIGEFRSTQAVVGPRASILSGRLSIVLGTIGLVQLKKLRLHIWGWIAYNDIFTDTPLHVKEFCRELTQVIGDVNTDQVRFVFTNCNSHNCSDRQCQDYEDFVSGKRGAPPLPPLPSLQTN